MRIWFVFVVLLGLVSAVRAQGDACEIDLVSVREALDEAETASDLTASLEAIRSAIMTLSAAESRCANWADETAGEARSNPVPFGERQFIRSAKDISVQVLNYETGLTDVRTTLPPNTSFAVAELSIRCEAAFDASCRLDSYAFDAVGNQGVVYGGGGSGSLPYIVDLFGGGETIIYVVWEVADGDDDLVMFYDTGTRVFFALE